MLPNGGFPPIKKCEYNNIMHASQNSKVCELQHYCINLETVQEK